MCVKLAPTIVTNTLAGMEEAVETMNLSKYQNRPELFNSRVIKDCSVQHYFSIFMKFLHFLALIGDYCSMVIFTPHRPKYVWSVNPTSMELFLRYKYNQPGEKLMGLNDCEVLATL